MKLFAIFAAVLAVAMGASNSWNVNQVSDALQDPNTNPALIPFLEQALNEMMEAIFAGYPAEAIQVAVPAVSTWTLHELSAALDDPATNPALIPYLEHALNEMMHALISGEQLEAIAVVVPADLAPVEAETPVVPVPMPLPSPVPAPSPVLVPVPMPLPSPVPAPSPVLVPSPEPVPSPVLLPQPEPIATPSSPLVQIIVNIAKPQEVSSPAVPVEEIVATPVQVVEQPLPVEGSFNPIDIIQPGGVAVNPIVPGPVVGPVV